jgi:hypothetical protein
LTLTYNSLWIEPSKDKKDEIKDSIPSEREDLIESSIIENSQFFVQGFWKLKAP